MSSSSTATRAPSNSPIGGTDRRETQRRIAAALSFRNIGAVYVALGAIIVFSLWVPETFLTTTTLRSMAIEQVTTALVAIGLTFALAAGLIDVSIGPVLGASAMTAAYLMVEAETGILTAILGSLILGLAVGLFNGFLAVTIGVDSLIATLGTSSILSAYTVFLSGNQEIIGLPENFLALGTTNFWGLAVPVYYLAVIALLAWYLLEHTPAGRYIYAIGGGREAARLSGVSTKRLAYLAMLISAVLAAVAGLIVATRINGGSPGVGAPYLLPAFAAAFLGATQFKAGRPNLWGTLLAVYTLAIIEKGFDLAGVAFWVKDLSSGLALILAVSLSVQEGSNRHLLRRLLRRQS